MANLAAWIISGSTGYQFPEITPISITLATLLTNLIGALIYRNLARRTPRTTFYYAAIVLAAAVADTLLATVNAPHPGFGVLANPLHVLVAATAITVLPAWVRRYA